MKRSKGRLAGVLGLLLTLTMVFAACAAPSNAPSTPGEEDASAGDSSAAMESDVTLTIATVNNPDMKVDAHIGLFDVPPDSMDDLALVQNRAGRVRFSAPPILYANLENRRIALVGTKRTDASMLWVMSTRMLPPAGVIVPRYALFQRLGLLDTFTGIIILYIGMSVPLVIWPPPRPRFSQF